MRKQTPVTKQCPMTKRTFPFRFLAAGVLLVPLVSAAQEIKAPTFHLPDPAIRQDVLRQVRQIKPAIQLLSEADNVLGPVLKAYKEDPSPEAYDALQRELSSYCANLSRTFTRALASRGKLVVAFQKLCEGMWRLNEDIELYAQEFRRKALKSHEDALAKEEKELEELADKYLAAAPGSKEKEELEPKFLSKYYAIKIMRTQVEHLRRAADFYTKSAQRAKQWAAALESLRGRVEVTLALMRSCADTLEFVAKIGRNRIEFQKAFKELFDYCEANGLYERAIDATHMLALVVPHSERFAWARKGIAMAEAGELTGWLGPLWNNIGWDYVDAGEYEQGLNALEEARKYHYEGGQELAKLFADYSVAYVKRLMGDTSAAKTEMQAVLDRAGHGKRIITFPAGPMIWTLRFLELLHLSPLYKWVYETAAEDSVFESHGVKVIIDPKSLVYLDGTELDFVREGLNEGFKFNNPNVRGECGCGESFNI